METAAILTIFFAILFTVLTIVAIVIVARGTKLWRDSDPRKRTGIDTGKTPNP